MRQTGIYAGWIGHDNLGDEAMFDVCRYVFPRARWFASESLHLVDSIDGDGDSATPAASRNWVQKIKGMDADRLNKWIQRKEYQFRTRLAPPSAILGGGTLLNADPLILRLYLKMKEISGAHVPIFGSGSVGEEVWTGEQARKSAEQWAEALSLLPVVGVRGPLTAEFLRSLGLTNVTISGDSAIWFHDAKASIPKSSGRSRLQVAFNVGICTGKLWGTQKVIDEAMLQVAKRLLSQGHHLHLISVWERDNAVVRDFAAQLGSNAVTLHEAVYDVNRFRQIIQTCHFSINVKLHVGILAATNNVPFIAIEYATKVRDFCRSIGWERFCLRPSDKLAKHISDAVDEMVANLTGHAQELDRRSAKLRSEFLDYCEVIRPLVERSAGTR